ncbi:class I fructose-bisphosphate aldolase [Bacillus daqingensis]|uniref:fructose-bisphosphate aldolase n=1 Tax=Bacillus daqingensis TaxID=872396 RepID=A0ABV9NRA6_9BACI
MATTNEILGEDGQSLLEHECRTIPKEKLYQPGPDMVRDIYQATDRMPSVLRSLQTLLNGGRLGGTGFLSILPVDQGIEHSAGASFAKNPMYFDPKEIVELALEAECSAVASTLGILGSVARDYAHRIPFIAKLNHNELLTYPETYDQILFGSVEKAFQMGAVAVGATVYFGSKESGRQIQEITAAFERAHELGMATILWAYLRNPEFKRDGTDYHTSADLSSQAVHLSANMGADIVKQKLPTNNGGYTAMKYGKTDKRVYEELTSEHPIDMTRYMVANAFMGRAGLINSGGGSGENDLKEAVKTAVINKRAGGMGLILGRKAFQKPRDEGVELIRAVQDVYADTSITLA